MASGLYSNLVDTAPATAYSLRQLLLAVGSCIQKTFNGRYWIVAEIASLQQQYNGHAYLELVEKDTETQGYKARVKAMIWRDSYVVLNRHFQEVTGSAISAGIKVMILVSVSFHEQYGLSLVIHNIDPSYTLGDIERQRKETIAKLRKAGILDLNRSIALSLPFQRIAVISSSHAAGYGDFFNHLHHNRYGICFYTALFVAKLQGEQAPDSIVQALDRILSVEENFDIVVIVRGGGASTDLGCFDDYSLSEVVAQFPLPILTGIGHDRDQSVVDRVAHRAFKTPTAVADFLVEKHTEELEKLKTWGNGLAHLTRKAMQRCEDLLYKEQRFLRYAVANQKEKTQKRSQDIHLVQHRLRDRVRACREAYRTLSVANDQMLRQMRYALAQQKTRRHLEYNNVQASLRKVVRQRSVEDAHRLERLCRSLGHGLAFALQENKYSFLECRRRYVQSMQTIIASEARRVEHWVAILEMAHPQRTLQRGFSVVKHNGATLYDVTKIEVGDSLQIRLSNGSVDAEVRSIQISQDTQL